MLVPGQGVSQLGYGVHLADSANRALKLQDYPRHEGRGNESYLSKHNKTNSEKNRRERKPLAGVPGVFISDSRETQWNEAGERLYL